MKQKNLILMVVAVGCGLLAAFLTSQMGAKPSQVTPQVEVLVVAKELPPGTKFTVDSIKDQFKKKAYNPEHIPEKAVISEDMLDGKTLNKTLRADDFLRESDLGNYQPLLPPEGKHVVSVRIPIDRMTPFVQPNSKVDLLGTLITKDGKVKSALLIPNVLVMAIDTKIAAPNGGAQGDLAIQLASVAANREEAMAIRIAEAANVKLSFILRSDNTNSAEPEWSLDHVKAWINGDDETSKVAEANPMKPTDPMTPTPTPEATTKMTVPTGDLPAGTELTNDLVQTKFKEVSLVGAPPANAVLNIKEHVGRFLVKDVAADQFVPKNYISDKLPTKDVAGSTRPGTDPGSAPKVDPPFDPPAKKLPTFDRTYMTPQGSKVFRYEIQESGALKLLGELQADGSVVPSTIAPQAPPKKDV